MSRRLPASPLTLWSLCVLMQAAVRAGPDPVVPTARLRLALSWLTTATDEGSAVANFWASAREAMNGKTINPTKTYIRRSAMTLRLEGICERLGCSYYDVRERSESMDHWPEW